MEWRNWYTDVILVPSSLLVSIVYHLWLWRKVRSEPISTVIGINCACRRRWVMAMMKDDDKKNILAVQTIRNAIMGTILMTTTCILLCTALAAVISSTYSVKKPLNGSVFGAHGELMLPIKYVSLLFIFLVAFFCYSLSIRFVNQATFLINVPPAGEDNSGPSPSVAMEHYVCELLERGFILNTIGNRLFYTGLPLLVWIFGPVLAFLSSVAMIPIFYNLDVVVYREGKGEYGV